MKTLLFTIAFFSFLSFNNLFGQISFTGYSIHAFGINSDQTKMFSFELKTFANRNFDDMLFEMNSFYNFKHATHHNLSVGLGLNLQTSSEDFMNAITLPFVIEVMPLKEFTKISLIFEISPEYYLNNEDINLRNLWGIRYKFGQD